MGINDLLKVVKECLLRTHISEFRGKVAAVDMMNWIYRGVYSCSAELNSGIEADLYLNFPLKMLSVLHSFNITIIAVFDGNEIAAKEKTDRMRKDEKNKNLQLANELHLAGNTDEARNLSRRAMKITGKIINTLIEILKKLGIRVIVAPYEADSQIAFLSLNNICDFAISEDSDLIPFGCKKVLYKMGTNGEGWLYDEDVLYSDIGKLGKFDYFRKLTKIQKIEFCVLMGCDYLPSLKGVGPMTTLKTFEQHTELVYVVDEFKENKTCIDSLKSLKYDYMTEVRKSVLMFMLQTVYDPITNQLVSVNKGLYNENIKYIENEYVDLFKTPTEKRFFFGTNFPNFTEYCNGELDVKNHSKIKETEQYDSIVKYFKKYQNYFKTDFSNKEKHEYKRISMIPGKVEEIYNNLNVPLVNSEELILDEEEINILMNRVSNTESNTIQKNIASNNIITHELDFINDAIDENIIDNNLIDISKDELELIFSLTNDSIQPCNKIKVEEKKITSFTDLILLGNKNKIEPEFGIYDQPNKKIYVPPYQKVKKDNQLNKAFICNKSSVNDFLFKNK